MGVHRVLVAWSSGKDSAWALHVLRSQGHDEVAGLLTTMNAAVGRVAMHAVRQSLLRAQARSVGLPVLTVPIPSPCTNAEYEVAMTKALARAKAMGVTAVAFGDLYLEDVRRYREERMAGTGIAPLFPLWGADTTQLAHQMVTAGLRAYVTCIDPQQLDASFAGRIFNEQFLAELPPNVDPCGERGEFHTFAYAGPMFPAPLHVVPGVVIRRDGFVFADLVLAPAGPPVRPALL